MQNYSICRNLKWFPLILVYLIAVATLHGQYFHKQTNEKNEVVQFIYFGDAAWLTAQKEEASKLHLLPKLDQVSLNNHKVTIHQLEYVCKLPHLKYLDIGYGPEGVMIKSNDLKALKHAKDLDSLNLCKGALSNNDLDVLPSLKKLKSLRIEAGYSSFGGASELTDEAGQIISKITSLESLSIGNIAPSKLGDPFIQHLIQLPTIRNLSISNSSPFSYVSLKLIAENLSLESLEISSQKFTASGLSKLAKITTLEHLSLENTPIPTKSMRSIASIPKLSYLVISIQQENQYELLLEIAGIKSLETLWLRDGPVKKETLLKFKKKHPELLKSLQKIEQSTLLK